MAQKQLGTTPANITDAVTKAYVDTAVAGASLTTVTVKDANFTIQDDGNTTKQMQFQLSAITAGQTRVLTIPDASTTLVGTDTAQPLTNKTISGASNTFSSLSQISVTETISSSSASSLTLTSSSSTYVFTGSSAATWTLPAVSGSTGLTLKLINRGTGSVTVQRAGTDNIYQTGTTITSISLGPGTTISLLDDGTYWLVLNVVMPVPAYDNTAASTYQTALASGTAFTWTQTVAAGAPYGIVAVTGYYLTNTYTDIAATAVVTFGGVTLTSLASAYYNGNSGGQGWLWVFGGAGIPSGTQTVSVTFTEATHSFEGMGFSFTYANVTKAIATTATNNVSPVTVTVTPGTSAPSMVWCGVGSQFYRVTSSNLTNVRVSTDTNSIHFGTTDMVVGSTAAVPVTSIMAAASNSTAVGLSLYN